MAKFRIDLDDAYDKADSIGDEADDLQKQITALTNLQTEVRSRWSGSASTVFQNKISALISEMTGTKTAMMSLASKIRAIASEIQREDERLAREVEKKL